MLSQKIKSPFNSSGGQCGLRTDFVPCISFLENESASASD